MTAMIWIDDYRVHHEVTLINTAGPYAYVCLCDGQTITVRRSQLHSPPAAKPVPRTIPTPAPHRSPKKRKEPDGEIQ